MTDSVKSTAEIQAKNSQGNILLDGKISYVLDCSGGKLNPSVGGVSILLLINNEGRGILESLCKDAGNNLVGDFKETDGTYGADLISGFVRLGDADNFPQTGDWG